MTWLKVIVGAIIIGVSVGLLNCVHALRDTSIQDPAIYFSFWILCGILIIMNSKSNLDSALKCFVFFLISQPLIYLVEVPFVTQGWGIFGYYKYWFIWTILCLPMGFIGHYMKKDKWWGLIILLPMMCLLSYEAYRYLSGVIYSFPHHLLSYLFSVCSLIIYPLFIFDNKYIRTVGTIIGAIAAISVSIIPFINRPVYETEVLCSTENRYIDNTYKVTIGDSKYGELALEEQKMSDGETFYCVHTKFYKTGKTYITVESPKGEKKTYDIIIGNYTYDIEERK